jgi:hypothetical protein
MIVLGQLGARWRCQVVVVRQAVSSFCVVSSSLGNRSQSRDCICTRWRHGLGSLFECSGMCLRQIFVFEFTRFARAKADCDDDDSG